MVFPHWPLFVQWWHTHTRIIIKNQLITFSLSTTEKVSKTFLNIITPALMKTLKI